MKLSQTVMLCNDMLCNENATKKEIIEIFKTKNISYLPVLDENLKLINIILINDIL